MNLWIARVEGASARRGGHKLPNEQGRTGFQHALVGHQEPSRRAVLKCRLDNPAKGRLCSMATRVRPLHDRVIVQRIEEEERTQGGIIIP